MKNKTLWIIGAIVTVIILIGGFFVWKSSSPVQEPTPSTNTAFKISSDTQGALAQMETAKSASIPSEWKSYSLQTTSSNLTFKYPANVIFKKIDTIGNSEGGVSIYY